MEISDLPEHLRPEFLLEFRPHHFWTSPKQKAKISLSDNFTDEVMRKCKIHYIPEVTHIIPYGEGKFMVVARVDVWKDEPKMENMVTAYASINEMPYKGGQPHYAQIAVTRALKIAVIRMLGISDHDVEMILDAYKITKADVLKVSNTSMAVRDVTVDDEPTETTTTEAPVEEIDLDLGL